jgi:hypothetical protein
LKERGGLNCNDEIDFIASHFHMFDSSGLESLKSVNVSTIESILSSQNLLLEDEDSLVEFISSLGEEFSTLYNYVECRFLTLNGINKLIKLISKEFEGLNCCVWDSICRRLQCEICNWNLDDERFSKHEFTSFPFVSDVKGGEWNGIISHLTKQCGGNVHEKGLVKITSSADGYNNPWQVVNYGRNDWWNSENSPNSWICFDFIEDSVLLQHYTLASHVPCDWFTEWEIEGSNDGNVWKSLDSRNTRELCGASLVKTYECQRANSNEYFRFIRMRQTGKASDNSDCLILCNIEFFGILKHNMSYVNS